MSCYCDHTSDLIGHPCCESVRHIKEWLAVMHDEPDAYVKLSDIYNQIKRIVE